MSVPTNVIKSIDRGFNLKSMQIRRGKKNNERISVTEFYWVQMNEW